MAQCISLAGQLLMLLGALSCAGAGRYYDGTYDGYASNLQNYYNNHGWGSFDYGYSTSNGISQQATGYIKNPHARAEDQIQVITGSYSYYGADGKLYTVTYIADENGFQPQGTHLASLPQVPGHSSPPTHYPSYDNEDAAPRPRPRPRPRPFVPNRPRAMPRPPTSRRRRNRNEYDTRFWRVTNL